MTPVSPARNISHHFSRQILRRFLLIVSAALTCVLLPSLAAAQDKYPSKDIHVIVPFGAGGGTDIIARTWGQMLAKATGVAVVIENKPGAASIIGAQTVANARPDGYTLLYTAVNTMSINPYVYPKLPYKVEDFVPITQITSVPYVLIVPPDSKVKTLPELFATAKAKPGDLTYGHYGVGQGTHVAVVHMLNMAGATMTDVPYKTSGVVDLMANRVDMLIEATSVALPLIQAGKVRALAVTSAKRLEVLPDTPTVGEVLPGFVGDSWHGVFAPKGTPAEAIATLERVSKEIVASKAFQDVAHTYGVTPVGSSKAEFEKFLANEAKTWSKVARDNNIRAQ